MNDVLIIDPNTTFIEKSVIIENGVTIFPFVVIKGNTTIKSGTIITSFTTIIDSIIGENNQINASFINGNTIGNGSIIGPNAHLRPGNKIGDNCRIGNFVEIKNSIVGDFTKIAHLTYIGDTAVGKNCNFGCGVVTANYNGKTKSKTVIGNNCFIGCNVNLIAPVTIGNDCFIAAGTTVTKNYSDNSFIIGRVKDEIKVNE